MWDQKPCFTLEISNFSNKEAVIASNVFEAGECEWYLSVHPKGVYGRCKDHLTLFLNVANRKYLRTGWQRRAKYYFLVLNESNKELYRSPIGKASSLFCAWNPSWGYRMPPSKFQEKGFLENDKLIIEVYIKVVDAFDGEGGDINGFQDFATYVASVDKIITEYVMNTLSKACNKLSELVNVGVKLDWLKLKFDEVTFKRKNAYGVDESFVQQLEERIKNLELMVSGFKKENLKSKLEVENSLERKESLAADGYCLQILEERIKNLQLMKSGFKKECLRSNVDEMFLELKKSYDADKSGVQKLEESVKNLDQMELVLKLDSLKSKLEEISLEKKKSHDAGESRAQKIEERVKNLELIDLGFKLACVNTKLDNAADESRVQQLEERIKKIELMDLGFKLDYVNTKLDNADEARVQQLEERIKNIELMNIGFKVDCLSSKLDNAVESRVKQLGFNLDCLNKKIEEMSLEKKRSDEAYGSRFQQLEESFKNVELMVSCLEIELDKKKDKSTAEGFLLVN